jgi:serine/threonine protein kinase
MCWQFMEYLKNGSFANRLKSGKLSDREIVRILIETATGIHAIHEAGVLHRDIKPSNILLDDQDRAKVADLGLAKPQEEGLTELTMPGQVLGTPSFMAPEQASGEPSLTTKRSDIYSLGSTAYFALTGRLARTYRNRADFDSWVAQKEPTPRLKKYRKDICPTLEAIVMRCMAPSPNERYETAAHFADDLQKWLKGEPTVAKPPNRVQRVKRFAQQYRVALGLIGCLTLLGGSVAIVRRELQPQRQIERALDFGQTATLIGPTGLPKFHRWKLNEALWIESSKNDNTWGFRSDGHGLVALVEDPRCEEYRFTIDVRHLSANQDQPKEVGIFWNYQEFPIPTGMVRSFFGFTYDDFRSLRNQKINRFVMPTLQTRVSQFGKESQIGTRHLSNWSLRYSIPELMDPDWRTIVIEVRKDETVIRMTDLDGTFVENRCSKANIIQAFHDQRHSLEGFSPGSSEYMPPFSSRAPLGIFSNKGKLAVRNAFLTPLKE